MEIIKINSKFNPLDVNTYLVTSNKNAILIDAGASLSQILQYNKNIKAIFLTHSHFDHVLFLEEIVNHFQCPIFLAKEAINGLKDPKINLSFMIGKNIMYSLDNLIEIHDNDIIDIDKIKVNCIETKGHTECGFSFLIKDNLFSGDTLFDFSIGRTDFPTSDTKKEKASLEKLAKLEFKTLHPGHGNVCPKNLDTINYFLELM